MILLLALQAITGCGTVAIPRTATPAQLETQAACFTKARDMADGAVKARADRLDTTQAPLTPIPSDFPIEPLLQPAWGSGAIPVSNAPDDVGAFRFICTAGPVRADDPIVYPGQPGKSHLHQFYGNDQVDANSTYASLRTSGESTCGSKVNRSAYWISAMQDSTGRVIRPDYISIYYKRYPQSSPLCTTHGNECVPIPTGLRFIFGWNMMAADGEPRTGSGYFTCVTRDKGAPAAAKWQGTNLAEIRETCPPGAMINSIISAPPCWDGLHLDSADHRSHLADWKRDPDTGNLYCPATHPKIIPTFTLQSFYPVDGTVATWRLSSDMGKPAGTTLHADYWEAWDPAIRAMWENGCLNRRLNCSGGDLGNGLQIKGAQ